MRAHDARDGRVAHDPGEGGVRPRWPLLGLALCTALAMPACGNVSVAPGITACGTESGTGCALSSARVDLYIPLFSRPTAVTHPLFPIGRLDSTLLLGNVEGAQLRVETTLLPTTRVFPLADGRTVETLISQYVAYLDGRLYEVALDYYAQDDAGAVWYFGEEVFNYDESGRVASTEGTWLTGRDGGPSMIMPARPRVGDVYRPEDIPGLVFEEVTVKAVGVRVEGPLGTVTGAMVVDELHQDGSHEQKTFAPGYGEFTTRDPGGDTENLVLAVPTDTLPGETPTALRILGAVVPRMAASMTVGDWERAAARLAIATRAIEDLDPDTVPVPLWAELGTTLTSLGEAIVDQDLMLAFRSAMTMALLTTDQALRYLPQPAVDLARFDLWLGQLDFDLAAGDVAAIRGDAATLGLILPRFVSTLSSSSSASLGALVTALQATAAKVDLPAAAAVTDQLQREIALVLGQL